MLELLPYNLLPLCNNVTTPNQILPTYLTRSCDVVAANPLSPSHSVSGQSSTLHIHLLYSFFLNSTPHIASTNKIPRKKVETTFHLLILYHNLYPPCFGSFAPVLFVPYSAFVSFLDAFLRVVVRRPRTNGSSQQQNIIKMGKADLPLREKWVAFNWQQSLS